MFRCGLTVLVVVFLAGISASPNCDQQVPAKCTQPALQFFLQRYNERKIEEITDAKWAQDMLQQCQLDQNGRDCLMDFARQCFPVKQSAESVNVSKKVRSFSCQDKVTSLTTGCVANTSVWHKVCEAPLVGQLYTYLTMTPSSVPSEVALKQIHTQICCQIDHYRRCVEEKAKAACNAGATTTFQEMFKDLHAAYQCDPTISFKDKNC